MVRWLRWHCPPDTEFEIRALAVWGRARYLSVTEAPRNTDFHTWMGKKHFFFFQIAEIGNRTPNSGVKGRGANHYPRAPAHLINYKSKLDNQEVITASLRNISATTKMILATDKPMSFTEKRMSVTTKVILTAAEIISATTKVILATEEVITTFLRILPTE